MSANDPFVWSASQKIGIQEIDEQHRVLGFLLNQLRQAVLDQEAARPLLDRLAEYTRTHFLLEESLMRLVHYPGFEGHQRQHEELVQEVEERQLRLDRDNAPVDHELLDFLDYRLARHIQDSDRHFGGFFQTAGLAGYSTWSNEVQAVMKRNKWWWRFW